MDAVSVMGVYVDGDGYGNGTAGAEIVAGDITGLLDARVGASSCGFFHCGSLFRQ